MVSAPLAQREWEALHAASARDHLRAALAEALRHHLELMGKPGFLTPNEIQAELLAAFAAVEVIASGLQVDFPAPHAGFHREQGEDERRLREDGACGGPGGNP